MAKIPLYYTFGNHMHWVDMQWLWGYHVLPGSIQDMLHFCRETGARGNVNFDGIGYEKLAAEDPEALAELREAVQAGIIEPVGCSYGQPYGLFHGGESNIRQRIYGARTVRRLLGVWPKTFWEEEFDFFPQLPQMLKGCGFEYASLFFQWTWHTPEVPKEDVPVVWWEGQDGSRLLCATRNKLNLHQWPEDMDATFAELAETPPTPNAQDPTPLILQWLELMPSPDWMCRSEVLLPKMRELLADERFEIRMATLGEYLRGVASGMGVPPMVSSDVSSEIQAGHSSDAESELDIRQGAYLPHWTKDGATYAVTFRLEDALPKHIQQQYSEERDVLQKMHDEGRLKSTALAYELMRLRTEKVEKALDAGHGACLLREPRCAEIVANALRHFDGGRYDLLAYAVMPNHVHAVVQPRQDHSLDKILHSWKSFTAHEINKHLGRSGTVWQAQYYDHLVRGEQDLGNQIRYVMQNPAKAGMPDWPWVYRKPSPSYKVDADTVGLHDRDGHGNHGRDAHATPPVRRYSMDEVWHGMSLGKNADFIRERSRQAEEGLTSFESLFSVLSLFGRPYAQWDVYPTWELEEAWRKLLSAQHHDNDECEGLCSHIAKADYAWIDRLSKSFSDRVKGSFREFPEVGGAFNPNGWEVGGIEPFGFGPAQDLELKSGPDWNVEGEIASFEYERLRVVVDLATATILELTTPDFPDGVFSHPVSLLPIASEFVEVGVPRWEVGNWYAMWWCQINDHPYECTIRFDAKGGGFRIDVEFHVDRPLNGGFRGALKLDLPFRTLGKMIRTDTPYGVVDVKGRSKGRKKYPTGDWMTSPQWFEEVESAFFGLSFVDFSEGVRGVMVRQVSPKQWFRGEDSVQCVMTSYDPWDENEFDRSVQVGITVIPHGDWPASTCWKVANTKEPMRLSRCLKVFSALSCDAPNVIPTAFYRETEDFSGKHIENYAGKGMGYPFVVRLVEFDGLETEATLTVAGTVAAAYKTNHLGQIIETLHPPAPSSFSRDTHSRPDKSATAENKEGVTRIPISLRPYEIATVYLDIVEGRKQTRDLDAKREIWATVHRVED